jgi:hypothetical protein
MPKATVAPHEDLFSAEIDRSSPCDACGRAFTASDGEFDNAESTYELPGQGIYLWTRGDDVRFERVPLCPSCASAIGMTALARWEIEEEEG